VKNTECEGGSKNRIARTYGTYSEKERCIQAFGGET